MSRAKQRILVRRLEVIREKYDRLIYAIMEITDPSIKSQYLALEQMLNSESKALKDYLNLLVEDPCPEKDPNLVCAGCPKEEEHIKDGTITARDAFLAKGRQDD